MKFALPTTTNNAYWDADYFLIELTPAIVTNLRESRKRCIEFLKSEQSDHIGVVGLDADSFHLFPEIGSCDNDFEWNDESWQEMPDSFEPNAADGVSVECVTLRCHVNGTLYLQAYSRYSSDSVRAEIPDALLDLVCPVHSC